MRLSLRFIIPLFLALGALAYAVVPLVDKLALQWFERDLDLRATLIASTVQEPLRDLIRAGNRTRLLQFFTRISQDERLYAVGFCPMGLGEPIATPTLPTEIRRSEEHTSELQSQSNLVCRLLLEKKKTNTPLPRLHGPLYGICDPPAPKQTRKCLLSATIYAIPAERHRLSCARRHVLAYKPPPTV